MSPKGFLSDEEVKQLRQEHKHCREKRFADRIKAILFLNNGDSYEEIARRLMIDDSTTREYYSRYVQHGLAGLLQDGSKGGQSFLSAEQLIALENHLQQTVYLTAKEIKQYILQQFAIDYQVEAVRKLLGRMGFVYKKPRHTPSKADPQKQQAWVVFYEQLKKQKAAADKIYFMDGCHPLYNSVPAYGWIKKGVHKILPANTGRERLNLNGAYNIEDHQVIIRNDTSINSQSTISLFGQVEAQQPEGKIFIVADNAPYYRSKIVNEYLQNHLRIQLLFLPPYSPNLNLIERLWLLFKKKTLYNQYYSSYNKFKEECLNFFEKLSDRRTELQTLMTENFPIIQGPLCPIAA